MSNKRKGMSSKSTKIGTKRPVTRGPMDRFVKRNGTVDLTGDTSSNLSTSSTNSTSRANLCGMTDIKTVTSIVDEWVSTETELLDEDVAYMMGYCYELVEDRDFNMLKCVMDQFYQSVLTRNDINWKEAYNSTKMCIESELETASSSSSAARDLVFSRFEDVT
ncbi:uncharacterized protein LOC141849231 [Brevipalpus obovatus]|uniref:uncharacterized protein LOC141849231 n=1 Tax=Brevipalpus obovatus TaxID=246614 RepID=UPI003D9F1722